MMAVSTEPFALVVDDNALILIDASDILEEAGFRVLQADDGEAAMTLLTQRAERVVLLFSDVEMPGMNGFELARRVDEQWPHIEIVITSGRMNPASGEMPERATFIPKPFNAQSVKSHLAQTLPDGKKPEPLKQAM